jgi:hypothetical protein
METLKWLIIMLLAMGIHEVGHWVAFCFYGIKAKLGFYWFGPVIGKDDARLYALPLRHSFRIYLMGVLWGAFYLSLYNPPISINLIYLLMCSMDIANMLQLYEFIRKHKGDRTITVIDASEIEIEEMRDKLKVLGITTPGRKPSSEPKTP